MKIIVEKCVIKPPDRPWVEWVASYDGFDDTGDDGLGVTRAEAVADLFDRFPEPKRNDGGMLQRDRQTKYNQDGPSRIG